MDTQQHADLVALRRDLHRHPEVRFQEHRTSQLLAARLRMLGFEVRDGLAGTGVTASVGSESATRHVVLRADMDALPTNDLKAVDYASTNGGVAHACGHDVHCTVVLGAAELLLRRGAVPDGCRLTVLLQPAEEIPYGEPSGAQAMLDAGAFDGVQPDAVLGLHCWPQLAAGTVGLDVRTAMAAKLAFKVTLRGIGAHAATPQLGADALLGASQVVVALHTLISREVDPGDRAALNVGTLSSGTSQSIVSATAELSGTVRTVDQEVATRLKGSIERVVAGISAAGRLEGWVEWKNEMPPVRNDGRLVRLAQDSLGDCAGVDAVEIIRDPPMTSDDFALYAARWPGLYMKLGVADPRATTWPSLHDGHFDVDETCLRTGVEAMAHLGAQLLRDGLDSTGGTDGTDGVNGVAARDGHELSRVSR